MPSSNGRAVPPSPSTGLLARLVAERMPGAGHVEPHERVGIRQQRLLLDAEQAILADPGLPFRLGRDIDYRKLGLLYYLMASAATVRDAVRDEAKFLPTADAALNGIVMQNEAAVAIEYVFKGERHELGKREGEFWATATVGMLRQFTRVELVPAAVESTYEGRSDRAEIEAYFNCRVSFEAAANRLMFDASTADLPLEQADPYLNALLVSFHENRLAGTDQDANTLAAKVAVTIAQGLADGTTTATSVARILGMSTRTLTRRLAEEGTSFGSILDQLRADLAVRYIQDLKVPIAEIAWRLGYKEPSAFTVAFKRWIGRPPAAIRREQRDKSPSTKNGALRHNRGAAHIRRSVRGHRA